MESKDIQKALKKPEIIRLQQIGSGIKVGEVLGDRILVEEIEPETIGTKLEKAGTLYIPDSYKEQNKPKPCTGVILKVGRGVPDYDRKVLQEGVAVLFSKYAGTSYTLDEREGLRVLDVNEVMCTLEVESIIAPIAKQKGADNE